MPTEEMRHKFRKIPQEHHTQSSTEISHMHIQAINVQSCPLLIIFGVYSFFARLVRQKLKRGRPVGGVCGAAAANSCRLGSAWQAQCFCVH